MRPKSISNRRLRTRPGSAPAFAAALDKSMGEMEPTLARRGVDTGPSEASAKIRAEDWQVEDRQDADRPNILEHRGSSNQSQLIGKSGDYFLAMSEIY